MIIDRKVKGDKLILTHASHIEPILKNCHELRKDLNNGFSDDRNFQHIGRIDPLELVKHPEWLADPSLIVKFLNSDEGKKYRTCGGNI